MKLSALHEAKHINSGKSLNNVLRFFRATDISPQTRTVYHPLKEFRVRMEGHRTDVSTIEKDYSDPNNISWKVSLHIGEERVSEQDVANLDVYNITQVY